MIFILHFVNMVYHIDEFADIAPFLHLWDKSHLIVLYDFFKCIVEYIKIMGWAPTEKQACWRFFTYQAS